MKAKLLVALSLSFAAACATTPLPSETLQVTETGGAYALSVPVSAQALVKPRRG